MMEELSHSTSALSIKEKVVVNSEAVDEKEVREKTSVSLLQEMCVAFKLGILLPHSLIYLFLASF